GLPALHRQDVDDVGASGCAAGLGDLIPLLPVDPAGVGEEEDIVVGGGGKDRCDIVLLPGGHALLPHAPLALGGILAGAGALDIAGAGEGIDTLLLLDQVLDVDLILHKADPRLPLVAVLVP